MKERPILMAAEMVRRTLADEKTQTRRVIRTGSTAWSWLQPGGFTPEFVADPGNGLCPYGMPGDRLWVRETWTGADWMATGASKDIDPPQFVAYRADQTARGFRDGDLEPFAANTYGWNWSKFDGLWRPSIFMPRWASRITLEVTEVRVQRLQDISGEDARAEGIVAPRCGCEVCSRSSRMCPADASVHCLEFANLWDSINAKRPGCSWEANPWVWAVSFRRLESPT